MQAVKSPVISRGNTGFRNPSSVWGFDEGSGVLVLDKVGRSDATLIGNPTWSVSPKIGRSLALNGTSQYALVSNNNANTAPYTAQDIKNNGVTLTAWVRVSGATNDNTNQRIIGGNAAGNTGYASGGVYLRSGTSYNFFVSEIYDGAYKSNITPSDIGIANGDVIFISVTYSKAGLATLYVNGKLYISFGFTTSGVSITPNNFAIGTGQLSNTTQEFWKGAIGNCGIHKSALTAREVNALYLRGYKGLKNNQLWIPDAVSAGGSATVIPIGQQATGSVGSPTATGAATTAATGVGAASAVGTPTAISGTSIPATVSPAGVVSASSVGTPTATGSSVTIANGVQAISSVGTPTANGASIAYVGGISAFSAVGTPTAIAGTSIPATALPAGVSAMASVGTPSANGASIAYAGGISAFAAVGAPTAIGGVSGQATALPAGVQAISYVGVPTATAAAVVYAYGVQAIGYVGMPIALGDPVAFTPSVYQAISPAQSYTVTSPVQSYTAISPAQSYTVTVQPQTYIA
jgi:hypothetical protein